MRSVGGHSAPGRNCNDMAMMQDPHSNVSSGQNGMWGTTGADGNLHSPIVTLAMLQCQMCTQRFSMSGKLSDHRTPVLAVNPSHSIEGPYCIACAGKRDGLRSFQIDEARVALCKLWHQQLSMGAAYAALHHHQQQRLASVTDAAAMVPQQQQPGQQPPPLNNNNTAGPVSAVQADIARRLSAKQDAPGMINGNSRPSGFQSETTALAMPDEHTTYAGFVGNTPPTGFQNVPFPQSSSSGSTSGSNKRQKLGANGYVKTTWTDEEDAILIEAVTTSTEQPFTRWSDLAHQLPGRVGKQIRDRWLNHLDPKIDRSPFTRDDDFKLYQAYKKHGKRWVEISTKFFDSKRSENHVKNRWYSAAFKKFVRTEIGDNLFEPKADNNNNNNGNSSSTNAAAGSEGSKTGTSSTTLKKKAKQEPPAATTCSNIVEEAEEKKEE